MKRNNKGFVGVDMTIAVIAVMIFSILIISLIYSNQIQNIKTKKEALAILYLTEIMENVGITPYEQLTTENTDVLIPQDLEENKYTANIEIISDLELSDTNNEEIIKKVKVDLIYTLGEKDYKYSMERIKIKE